jgi:arylsulfatase
MLDVMPTVLALCGAETPSGMDGRNISGLLAPDRFTEAVAPFRFGLSGPDNMISALREGPWKLHVRLVSQTGSSHGFSASREKPLLFNVEQDPGERVDRAAEHLGIVAGLLQSFNALDASIRGR